jgi:multiple sugar transport system permease protein
LEAQRAARWTTRPHWLTKNWVGYLFISPWLIGFCLFTAAPLVFSLAASFTNLSVTGGGEWVGIKNYQTILGDDDLFWIALGNTFFYTALYVPLVNFVALGLALLLSRDARGNSIFRTIYFLPSLMGSVVVAVLWRYIFGTNYGLLNAALQALGVQPIDWLGDAVWTKPALILMNLWTFGGLMLIDLAAMQQVPHALYDAARIDGAAGWARVRFITLPLIAPALFFNLVVSVIATLQIFTPVYIFTATNFVGAGPQNSLLFFVLYLYQRAFHQLQLGYASALAWLLLIVISSLTLLQFRLWQRRSPTEPL